MTTKLSVPCLATAWSVAKQSLATGLILAAAMAVLPGSAQAQASVNIVYPISGASYPITDPAPGSLSSAYFTASFSVTCKGDHKVEWGFDTATVGTESFYDQTSVQLVHKLPGGRHVFWVKADKICGSSQVGFLIGK